MEGKNSYPLICLDKCFLIYPMATLGNYMLTGQWMGDREIVVNGNRSGESALGVDLYEIPQWTFLDVQGLAEGS